MISVASYFWGGNLLKFQLQKQIDLKIKTEDCWNGKNQQVLKESCYRTPGHVITDSKTQILQK